MEYLGSDINIIKELLSRMEKFILDKSIDGSKANDIKDFKGLGKVACYKLKTLGLVNRKNLVLG